MYSQEIQEIHHAFATAGENLLAQSNEVIASIGTEQVSKVQRLKALGFTQSKQVVESESQIQQREEALAQANQIQDYAVRYPNQKFITKEQVIQICSKYKLVCGPVANYRGFVPEKNLQEIEAFKLAKRDVQEFFRVTKIEFTASSIDEDGISDIKRYLKACNSIVPAQEVEGSGQYNLERYLSHKIGNKGSSGYTSLRVSAARETESFVICAPATDFDTKELGISGWFMSKINKTMYREIPDPVVLQPVKGGYLIISAWGDEASDELVVNHRMN